MSARTSPPRTVSETPESATTPGKRLTIARISREIGPDSPIAVGLRALLHFRQVLLDLRDGARSDDLDARIDHTPVGNLGRLALHRQVMQPFAGEISEHEWLLDAGALYC